MNIDISEQLTFNSIISYVSENIHGIGLLILAFIIIYFVDYINRLNAVIFAPTSSIPGLASSSPTPFILKSKFKKPKKR